MNSFESWLSTGVSCAFSHYWHQGTVVSDPVLFSYSLDGSGGGAALHDGAVSRFLKDDQLAWAHLDADHSDTAA
ncbi:hypothetical protein N9I82_01850 [Alphaproteobacteria bacterium]|nr:hypothetical protein [Alphaproteobacteria bacterium]